VGSILLVEADPVTSDQWAAALRDAGHAIVQVHMSREVLPVIVEGGIDAVVLDAYDPRIGITDLAKKIAALPDAPPLVLISGSPFAPEISARIGAAAFLMKPCEPAEVVAVANRLVGDIRPVRIIEDEPTGRSRSRI
jgi:DNA-binding response OmpR family regulator